MSAYIAGIRAIEALLLHAPERVVRILHVDKNDGARGRVLKRAADQGVRLQATTAKKIEGLADGVRHQGLLAEIKSRAPEDWADLVAQPDALLVAFDQVTDPRNLGAILRSAEAFGATGALVTTNRCARPGPVVTRTSAGASELLPIAQETNLARSLREAKAAGYQVVGADMEGEAPGDVDLTGPTVLVIGAEGPGLRRLTKTLCDRRIRIPLSGATESLNASVAASILLYEAQRQRLASARQTKATQGD